MANKDFCDRCGKEVKNIGFLFGVFNKTLLCRRCQLEFEEWLDEKKAEKQKADKKRTRHNESSNLL